jgi:hypothetical protein
MKVKREDLEELLLDWYCAERSYICEISSQTSKDIADLDDDLLEKKKYFGLE